MPDQLEATTGEIMEFLKDHMVTKEDLALELGKMATKEDLAKEIGKMVTKEDFAKEMDKMATKEDLAKTKLELLDAMDDKLLNLKTDIVTIMRKEDHKIVALVGLLKEKQVLSDNEAKSVLGMEPFPQILLS